jgi:hypothetical protein
VNHYELEAVKEILRTEYSARCVSVARPRGEAWARSVGKHRHLAMLAWVRDELTGRIRAKGGHWLGPTSG